MRDATVEGTQVNVRYDPFDVSVGYAYIKGLWRTCHCPYTEFAGCSERELQQLSEELRQRNRLHAGRAQTEVTQKQLAAFRRENAGIEAVLRQQRRDHETRAALMVLEGGKPDTVSQQRTETDRSGQQTTAMTPMRQASPVDQLLVLPRIQL